MLTIVWKTIQIRYAIIRLHKSWLEIIWFHRITPTFTKALGRVINTYTYNDGVLIIWAVVRKFSKEFYYVFPKLGTFHQRQRSQCLQSVALKVTGHFPKYCLLRLTSKITVHNVHNLSIKKWLCETWNIIIFLITWRIIFRFFLASLQSNNRCRKS